MAAMVTSIGAARTMMLTAERADDIMLVPTRFKDGFAAFSLRVEIGGKFVDAIETAEVNHKSQVFVTYTEDLGLSFTFSRTFYLFFNELRLFYGQQVYNYQSLIYSLRLTFRYVYIELFCLMTFEFNLNLMLPNQNLTINEISLSFLLSV